MYILEKLLGSYSSKQLKKYSPVVQKINQLENHFQSYTREDCVQKTQEFRELLQAGKTTLENLLPEAFALVRQVASNTIGERPFDVQLLGGMALHFGAIAEMKTGEGKTLTSSLAVYLNALEKKGVHIVTVNEYLAKRDSQWMGEIFKYLGLSVGLIYNNMDETAKKEAYAADITYGTNNEFGFDYLRDNMKYSLEDLVQRELNYAVVDEIDSILIDEARTPLIISGPSGDRTGEYKIADGAVLGLTRAYSKEENPSEQKILDFFVNHNQNEIEKILTNMKPTQVVTNGDFVINEKTKNIQLTEQGIEKVEKKMTNHLKSPSLFDYENVEFLHLVNQSLKARYVLKKDFDYVLQDNQVKIVDEFTGRIMEGRRFSDGLHQAIECKEGVRIEKENQTLASITFQNYFRRYKKIAGMTGTALTEEKEFIKIYNLGVIAIPTNQKLIRVDRNDAIYKTKKGKHSAILQEVKRLYEKKQPVLIGTDSVSSSEELSLLLQKQKLPHQILNAKYHEKEAEIISKAGEQKAITISTNMAGRGTDIKLGAGVKESGGLYVLGTSRHDARRIDNQLRGRSGRQGDLGESRFFLSLEDDLLRTFGGKRVSGLMDRLKIDENEAIEHTLISKAIVNAQKKVEGQNFNIRKHLLEYDDVMNRQREVIYKKRKDILSAKANLLLQMIENWLEEIVEAYCKNKNSSLWELSTLIQQFHLHLSQTIAHQELEEHTKQEKLIDFLLKQCEKYYQQKKEEFGEITPLIEKQVLLLNTDNLWKEHLLSMEHLKEGIGLRGFGQKNPLEEYKREAFDLFSLMLSNIRKKCIFDFFHLQVQSEQQVLEQNQKAKKEMHFIHGETQKKAAPSVQPIKKPAKIGRNDPCICGSGKKYKQCCLNK